MRVSYTRSFTPFTRTYKVSFPSVTTKNLFLPLAESHNTNSECNLVLCFWRNKGINMGDHWPWEAKELNPQPCFNETILPGHKESVWLLKTSIIGNYCISRPKGQFSTPAGDLICLGQKFYKDAPQETQCHTEPQPHLLANFPKIIIT
jgi:hypothetical protein